MRGMLNLKLVHNAVPFEQTTECKKPPQTPEGPSTPTDGSGGSGSKEFYSARSFYQKDSSHNQGGTKNFKR